MHHIYPFGITPLHSLLESVGELIFRQKIIIKSKGQLGDTIFSYTTLLICFFSRESKLHTMPMFFKQHHWLCFSQKSVGKELGESFLKHNILCPNLQHGVKKGTDGDWFLHSPHSIVVSDIYSNEGI